MSDAPREMVRLARNVEKILTEAGVARASDSALKAGFRVFAGADAAEVSFVTGDYLEPSYQRDVDQPLHRDHPLLMFRRSVESTMLTAYVAVLHAAGFTVTLRVADEDDNDHLLVTAGPLEGIDPTQEIKDLHNRS